MEGGHVWRRLKRVRPTADIPVVMISISNDRAKAFSLGALEHLVKPVAREELLEVLGRRDFTTRVKTQAINVLCIDDDPKQLELYRVTLEPQGFRVQAALSGR